MTLVQEETGPQISAEPNNFSSAPNAGSNPGAHIHDTGNVTMEDLDDGTLRIMLRPGSHITHEDGAAVRARILARSSGAGTAVLLQITGVESVARDAVQFFSEATTVTAFAILGHTPVDRVIGHGLHGLHAPQCPSRYFTDQQQALSWLQGITPARPRTR